MSGLNVGLGAERIVLRFDYRLWDRVRIALAILRGGTVICVGPLTFESPEPAAGPGGEA